MIINLRNFVDWVIVGLYVSVFIGLIYRLRRVRLIKDKDKIEFKLKTSEQDNYEIDLRYITGSFIVSINEISKLRKSVMRNGAMSVYIISVASGEQCTLQRLTCLEGFHKERLHLSLKNNKMTVKYAPIPRDDINEYRVYQVKFNEL